jgi:hypothetical protein
VRACLPQGFGKVIHLESERLLIKEYWEETCSPAQFEGY